MKERKRTYTEEEVNELKKWFDSQSLPPTMQIDKAAFTPNLKDTVDMPVSYTHLTLPTILRV